MTIAIVALAVVVVAELAVLVWVLDRQAQERRRLVDRAIARHANEIIALDREPKPPRPDKAPNDEVNVVGLS